MVETIQTAKHLNPPEAFYAELWAGRRTWGGLRARAGGGPAGSDVSAGISMVSLASVSSAMSRGAWVQWDINNRDARKSPQVIKIWETLNKRNQFLYTELKSL